MTVLANSQKEAEELAIKELKRNKREYDIPSLKFINEFPMPTEPCIFDYNDGDY